ncbi:cysteine-rich repeat secretory protein 38-like [Prunus avium]|uniref:Cysteine-rich repeat secretory protein 38-like n=1 Tax=Prunus avium TaxID=42229 RepID=A0A6P5S7C1_PRUAV|nr:cysteine-rich repeat secretory protein 38-like [Prunus avium]
MGSSRLLIFFVLPILLVLDPLAPTIADDHIDKGVCTKTADYCWSCFNTNNTNNGSIYNQNLNTLLSSFPSDPQINPRFYNSSLGQGPDKVNAIAVCRGDVASEDCRTCFKDSVSILLQNCTNQKEAIIWAQRCTVRYSNISIFGVLEYEPVKFVPSPNKISNAEQYKQVRDPLFGNLSEKAAAGDSVLKFAAGNASVPVTNQTIYATVQCSPDLDKQNCSDCLKESISDIPQHFGGVDGGRVLRPSCNLRFESKPFYESGADTLINLPGEQGNNTSENKTTGNNTSNITTKVSPPSFFRLALSLCLLILSAFAFL